MGLRQPFPDLQAYKNRVKTTSRDQVFSLPVNLHTINQFFGKTLRPDEAKAFIEQQADTSITDPQTFEEQALRFVGRDLYEAFFEGYTQKQWGCSPKDLPASILKRLPVRFNYDDDYFFHKFQGMPGKRLHADGRAYPGSSADRDPAEQQFRARAKGRLRPHILFGALDGYFDYAKGRLGYRTLDFERFTYDGDYQGCAVMNYGELSIPYTRITEHKHFSPWEKHEGSVCYREFARECGSDDIPYSLFDW